MFANLGSAVTEFVAFLMTASSSMLGLNRELVLENDVVVGSVNANLQHYDLAAAALARADPGWLDRLITRRVPLDRAGDAFDPQPDDVKVIITLND